MRRVFVFLTLFALGTRVLLAQEQDCMGYSDAIQDPARAYCIILDCRTDDCSGFFNRLQEYPNLTRLEIANLDRDYFPRDVRDLKQLQSLSVSQSPEINYNALVRKLAALPALATLTLDNDGLRVVPKTIVSLHNLTRLVIRNNENFDPARSINYLKHLPGLKELAIPVNQIDDLPESISSLRNLEVLDLSDNQLTDLPKQMGEMDSLEVLYIEKNIIVNPVQTLEKLKGLNIRYISFDPVQDNKDREKLLKIFPKAEIVEVVDSTATEEEPLTENAIQYDSVAVDSDTGSYEFRTIVVQGENFHAISDAYLHYPAIFDHRNFRSTFDSLLFEERYMDTSYSNIWKIQPWRYYNNLRLFLYKDGDKGEIWFDFHPDDKKGVPDYEPYMAKNNPEMMVFLGLKWVYQGPLTKRQFVKEFIKTPAGYRYWMDVRVYYNERDKNFTLELKDRKGFTQIQAYLRNRSNLVTLEKAQESYEGYFERYTKALDARRKRFHKRLFKDRSAYEVTMQRSVAVTWESFQKMYMGPEEQHMPMKNWLEYYDQVLADEHRALNNATPSGTLFERILLLDGYSDASNMPLITDTGKMKGVYSMFRDDNKNMVAVVKITLVNLTDKNFRTYDGSLGLKNIRLYFQFPARYAIVAEIRNGDIGVIGPDDFAKVPLHHNLEYIFMLERLSRKISTIGQIRDMIGM